LRFGVGWHLTGVDVDTGNDITEGLGGRHRTTERHGDERW